MGAQSSAAASAWTPTLVNRCTGQSRPNVLGWIPTARPELPRGAAPPSGPSASIRQLLRDNVLATSGLSNAALRPTVRCASIRSPPNDNSQAAGSRTMATLRSTSPLARSQPIFARPVSWKLLKVPVKAAPPTHKQVEGRQVPQFDVQRAGRSLGESTCHRQRAGQFVRGDTPAIRHQIGDDRAIAHQASRIRRIRWQD